MRIPVWLFVVWLCGAGCASKPQVVDCQFGYEKDAIVVDVVAERDLNVYNNQPHTVVTVFYQLSDPNIFKEMLGSQDGVSTLLQGESFDSTVLSRSQKVVQPGDEMTLTIDRVEGARYLGIVGGFYDQQAQRFSKLVSIPTRTIKSLLLRRVKGCVAEPLEVHLHLGNDGFLDDH